MIAMDFHMPQSGETFYGKYYVPGITDGVIILVHGLGEHCGRYEEHVVPALLGANLGVITYDQFGHGVSEHSTEYNAARQAGKLRRPAATPAAVRCG